MHTLKDRSPAGIVVQAAAAVAVCLFACGSSSVPALLHVGHPGRWVALVALLAAAAWWAADGRSPLAVDVGVAAAAVFFVLLTAVSAAWSVDPRLTVERAVTLAVLVGTALLVAQAVAGRHEAAERVLTGLLAGSVIVAVAGIFVYALAHRDAVEASSPEIPPRFKGMGQNPNTASLLYAVALPIAVWLLVAARSGRGRAVAGSSAALLAGSLVASGSHGALAAASVGCAVVMVAGARRATAAAVGVTVVAGLAGVGIWIETLPQPSHGPPPSNATVSSPPAAKPGYFDAEINTPLNGELGIPLPGQRNPRKLVTSSGRIEAWGGAIRQAEQRAVTGYGFGTESAVFIDRWWTFTGGLPENSYIGIALQLGIAGLLAFGTLLLCLFRSGVVSLRRQRTGVTPAAAGVLAAALVAAIGQSYIYSVGNIATLTVWVTGLLLGSVVRADA